MVKSLFTSAVAVILLNIASAQVKADDWFTVNRGGLCVTEGTIEKAGSDRMSVDVPKMRAYVTSATEQSVEMRFRYAGSTRQASALGSGQIRRQLGLKLRAQDPCNLVYAMWRIDPEPKLVVSVKRNPSEHTSPQCGNRGYTNVKPLRKSAVPQLSSGESHTLRAELKKQELRVFIDNHEVWQGDMGADAAQLEGPVGLRSDNAQFEFDFKARQSQERRQAWPCKSGDSD